MMKVFDSYDMPDDVRTFFFESNYQGNDCYVGHEVNAATWYNEENGCTIPSEEHNIVDAWLLENGAQDSEYVLINHSW